MAVSLIPELEDVVRHGTRAKRVDALQRITALFLDSAKSYSDAHVEVFDDVFGLLIEKIETKARAELSRHLAPVGNAPVKVLRMLANDDDIAVAGPVLKYAPRLAETDLVGVATTKSQAHLQAISARPALGVAVTDVLERRGDREVVRCVPTIAVPGFPKMALSAWSGAPRTTAFWPKRSACARISPSRCSVNC
jgi:uncharacterized protein (DUF2336 family)